MKFIALAASSLSLIYAQTFVEILTANNFTALLDAVKAANLTESIAGLHNATVFVPTNAAFEQIKGVNLSLADLQAVLFTHAVNGTFRSTDLKNGSVPTLNGKENLTIVVANGNVTVNGISVVKADIVSSQGVAHVIEKVIIPSSLKVEGNSNDTSSKNNTSTKDKVNTVSEATTASLSLLSILGLFLL